MKNNKKICLILLILCFLFPLFNVFFVVGEEPEDSFYAINESNNPTQWILQGSEISPIEDFHDDINMSYWASDDANEIYFEKLIPQQYDYILDNYTAWDYTEDSYYIGISSILQLDIFWDGMYWWVSATGEGIIYKYDSDWIYTGDSYNVGAQSIMPQSIFFDGTNWWITGINDNRIYKYNSDWIYTGDSYEIRCGDTPINLDMQDIFFDGINWWMAEGNTQRVWKYDSTWGYSAISYDVGSYTQGIYWDGINWWVVRNTDEVYKYNSDWTYTGDFYELGLGTLYYKNIFLAGTNWYILRSTRGSGRIYEYCAFYNISKNYFGSGYMYMQTDTTELISLKSTDYTTHYNLSSGDYFEVDFQTSSDSQINLILLKDGVVNKTLILSQSSNTNFNRHTVQISVDEFVEFDQLKISSTFEDTDNVKVYDIKTYKYTITGDYANFLVGAKSTHSIYLAPDIYNMRIFEGELEVVKENIIIGSTDYFYVYTPIKKDSNDDTIVIIVIVFIIGVVVSLGIGVYIIYKRRK